MQYVWSGFVFLCLSDYQDIFYLNWVDIADVFLSEFLKRVSVINLFLRCWHFSDASYIPYAIYIHIHCWFFPWILMYRYYSRQNLKINKWMIFHHFLYKKGRHWTKININNNLWMFQHIVGFESWEKCEKALQILTENILSKYLLSAVFVFVQFVCISIKWDHFISEWLLSLPTSQQLLFWIIIIM